MNKLYRPTFCVKYCASLLFFVILPLNAQFMLWNNPSVDNSQIFAHLNMDEDGSIEFTVKEKQELEWSKVMNMNLNTIREQVVIPQRILSPSEGYELVGAPPDSRDAEEILPIMIVDEGLPLEVDADEVRVSHHASSDAFYFLLKSRDGTYSLLMAFPADRPWLTKLIELPRDFNSEDYFTGELFKEKLHLLDAVGIKETKRLEEEALLVAYEKHYSATQKKIVESRKSKDEKRWQKWITKVKTIIPAEELALLSNYLTEAYPIVLTKGLDENSREPIYKQFPLDYFIINKTSPLNLALWIKTNSTRLQFIFKYVEMAQSHDFSGSRASPEFQLDPNRILLMAELALQENNFELLVALSNAWRICYGTTRSLSPKLASLLSKSTDQQIKDLAAYLVVTSVSTDSNPKKNYERGFDFFPDLLDFSLELIRSTPAGAVFYNPLEHYDLPSETRKALAKDDIPPIGSRRSLLSLVFHHLAVIDEPRVEALIVDLKAQNDSDLAGVQRKVSKRADTLIQLSHSAGQCRKAISALLD